MTKFERFLLLDSLLVAAGLAFFFWSFQRNKRGSQFREDLWKEKKAKEAVASRQAFEDQVDQKILLEHRPDPAESPGKEAPKTAEKSEFRLPNFRGQPHEILGIPADSGADLIARAFKHWIKKYHPDRVEHLGPTYVEQARRRAEQLNTARQQMLASVSQRKTT